MKKYKLIYEKAGHVYGSESGIPSVNDDKFECTAKEGYLYGFDYKSAKVEPTVIEEPIVISEPVVEADSEVTIEAPVVKEVQPQSKKNNRKKTAPVAETATEESAE